MNPQFAHHWEKCCQVDHNIMLSCYLELFYNNWKSFQIVRFIMQHSYTPVVKRKKKTKKPVKIFLTNLLALLNIFNSVADVHFFSIWCPSCFLWNILPAARHPICQFGGWYFLILQLPQWLSLKNLPGRADKGSIPGSARSPREGNGNPLQYSCLQNPTDRGAGWATVHGVEKESDIT